MTTGGQFVTDAAAMATAATHVRDVNAQVQTELLRLQQTATEAENRWRGGGGTTFQALMGNWQTESQKLSRALEDIAELVATGGKGYTDTDTTSSAALKQAAGALNM